MYHTMSESGTPIRFDPIGNTNTPGHLKEYLLCEECEKKLNLYEDVAARFFRYISKVGSKSRTGKIYETSLDYHNIKLFFLSLLWRCAVSSDAITQKVSLGSRLSQLTFLLQQNDPGTEDQFAIILRVLEASPEAKNAVLTIPIPMRRAGRRGYAMVGNGAEISWITDKQGVSQEDVPSILRQDGSWSIDTVPAGQSLPWKQAVNNAVEQENRIASRYGTHR